MFPNFFQLCEAIIDRPEFHEKDPTASEALDMLHRHMTTISVKNNKLPQIPADSYKTGHLQRFLKAKNIKITEEYLPVNTIIPCQEINYNKVASMLNQLPDKPLLIIRNFGSNLLIDGHTQWAAHWCLSKMHPDNKYDIHCMVLHGQDVKTILDYLTEFAIDVKNNPEATALLTIQQEITPEDESFFANLEKELTGPEENLNKNELDSFTLDDDEDKPPKITPKPRKPIKWRPELFETFKPKTSKY